MLALVCPPGVRLPYQQWGSVLGGALPPKFMLGGLPPGRLWLRWSTYRLARLLDHGLKFFQFAQGILFRRSFHLAKLIASFMTFLERNQQL